MELLIEGTMRALFEGIHNPPIEEGEAPFPAEYIGTLELSLPSLKKKTAFGFALDISNDDIELLIGRIEDGDKPLTKILPSKGAMTDAEKGFFLVFSFFIDNLEDILLEAIAESAFYESRAVSLRGELKDESFPLIKPVFTGDKIQ